jgi:signal transduction histidine kinase
MDLLIVAIALEGAVEAFVERGAAAALGVVAITLPLLTRGRFAFGAPAAVWLLGAALSFVDGHLVPDTFGLTLAGMAAAYLLGHLRADAQARAGLAIVVGAAAVVAYNEPGHAAGDLVLTPVLFAIAWVAGFALRERAQQAEAAELRATLAAAEERARIGRELHDIVAHAVSVMVLQVGAVRHRLPESGDRETLLGVEQTGRTALTEMRRLVGAMRREEDELLAPQPGLEALGALAADVTRAGLPVTLHVEGAPVPLPPALDLSAYRIVQEGLTNALKHAHAGRADVTITYAAGELGIEVRDDGGGERRNGDARRQGIPARGRGQRAGHGLVGVGERVKLYGGEMSAGGADGGGFVLRTRLPLGGAP